MTKDDLMQMALDHGVLRWAKANPDSDAFATSLQYMANAILERAAVECSAKAKQMEEKKWIAAYEMNLGLADIYEKVQSGALLARIAVLELKIPEGE